MQLRTHVVRLIAAALLPAMVLSLGLGWMLLEREERAQRSSVLAVAITLAGAVEAELQRSISLLELLAESDELDRGDLDGFVARLRKARDVQGAWGNVGLFAPDGRVLRNANTAVGATQPDIPIVPDVPEIARAGKPLISPLRRSNVTGSAYLGVGVPVVLEGRVRYVLWARIDSTALGAFLKARLPPGWIAAVDDREGVIAARSEAAERFVGKAAVSATREAYRSRANGIVDITNVAGELVVAGFQRLEATGLVVIALVPAHVIFEPRQRIRTVLVLVFLACLGLSVLMANRMVTPIVRALNQLSAGIGQISKGWPVEAVPTRVDEVDRVVAGANDAAREIRARTERVSALQEELVARALTAEEANRAKDRFLAMLGHELRNPIAGISNAGHVVLKLAADPTSRKMAEVIRRQTVHLDALLGDLLDVSKAVSGKMRLHREPVPVRSLVLDAVGTLEAAGRLTARRVQLQGIETEAAVHGDRQRLHQVLVNVLDNAVKFTTQGGRIGVRVAQTGQDVAITVEDDGCGVSPSALPRIFEPFEQEAQPIHRPAGGLGLGLAIARHIVLLHEGAIEARSAGDGRGTTIVITLPRMGGDTGARADERAVRAPESVRESGAG